MEDEFLSYLAQQGQRGTPAPAAYGGGSDDPGGMGYAPTYDTYIPNMSTGQNDSLYLPQLGSGAPMRQETPAGGTRTSRNQQTSSGVQTPKGSLAAYITEAATKRGIDPNIALLIAEHEGGYDDNDPARLGDFGPTTKWGTGKSWWPFQLHYGGAGTPYAHMGNTAGMGNDFTERTGYQPGDPEAVYASIDFALDHARKYGWSAWYGRGPAGVGEWDGIPR